MYAREVEAAATRLETLRRRHREQLGLAVFALVAAPAAAWLVPSLALPLLVGGIMVAALGVRTAWDRFVLLERLAEAPDAAVIPAVREHAGRTRPAGHAETGEPSR